MRLPKLVVAVKGDVRELSAASHGVMPQGCGLGKKLACAAAVAACTTACLSGVGTPACASCFAAVGAGSCIDCA